MQRLAMDVVRSVDDPSLVATIGVARALLYTSEAALAHGLPPFVRAASALRNWGNRRVVVQDDVLALAVLDAGAAATAPRIEPLLLPPGTDGARVFDIVRGNKDAKPDLEAALVLPDGRLVVFGSGASAARELVFVATHEGPVRRRQAADLYALLRSEDHFSGAGLNIEGALVSGERIVLVQRGNAAPTAHAAACNAMGEIALDAFLAWLDEDAAAPPLLQVRQFDLGTIAGSALGITDVCLLAGGRMALLACAERSSSALTDGPVLGCRFGVLDAHGLRTTDILDTQGARCLLKLEGLEHCGRGRFDVVADIDDPGVPASMATLQVAGL